MNSAVADGVASTSGVVQGVVTPGFEAVRTAFAQNFEQPRQPLNLIDHHQLAVLRP